MALCFSTSLYLQTATHHDVRVIFSLFPLKPCLRPPSCCNQTQPPSRNRCPGQLEKKFSTLAPPTFSGVLLFTVAIGERLANFERPSFCQLLTLLTVYNKVHLSSTIVSTYHSLTPSLRWFLAVAVASIL